MKKKLEADLISIAHRILQLKNKSDINQLFLETQKLYEKLAVLRFVEEYFGEVKPTVGQAEVVEKMKEFFENIALPEFQRPATIHNITIDETPVIETIADEVIEENKIEPEVVAPAEQNPTSTTPDPFVTAEELEDIIAEKLEIDTPIEKPLFALEKTETEPIAELIIQPIETTKPETPKKKEIVQISFDDLLGGKYSDPDFVKVAPSDKKQALDSNPTTAPLDFQREPITTAPQTAFEKEEPKSITLNDKLVKEITIGLNDRIAFVKHLFGGNNEDYNRVLSQLITFDTFIETKTFIDELVKPDYNNWEGKEDYEHRFMEIIEKKFLSF
jgi:hypothetical protein